MCWKNSSEHVKLLDDDEEKRCGESSGCWYRFFPSGFIKELKAIIVLTCPMIVTQVCQYMLGPVALMFCGHLGQIELASVALANSFINITGLSIAIGLSSACDTLFAQVYGSVNRRKLGVYLQRSILIHLLAVLPCWAIHLNMEALLRLLGQDPLVARLAGKYLAVFMPGVPCFFLYVCLSKYLQCQNIVVPITIIGGVVNAIHALLQYLFVYTFDWSLDGSSMAQVVAYFLMMFLTLLYIIISKVYKDTWEGLSWESLSAWGQFFKLGMFGLVMLCAEYWSFEIGIITAGLIGVDYLGAMSVIFQLETFAYMLPLGTGIAASIRVGQYLGAGDAQGAQTAARVTMASICVAELGVALIFLTLKDYLPLIFTNVETVVPLVTSVLPICAILQVFDGFAGTGAGILRGQGRQQLGAIIVLCGYASALIVGAPLMLYTPLRLHAFWGALCVALSFEGITFAIIIHNNDWDKQAKEALERVEAAKKEAESETRLDEELSHASVKSEKLKLICNGTSNPHQVVTYTTDHTPNGQLQQSDHHKQGYKSLDHDTDPPGGDGQSWSSLLITRILTLVLLTALLVGGIFLRIFYTNTLQLPPPTTVAPSNATWQYTVMEALSTMNASHVTL